MRMFYQAFPNCGALRHELNWTHYRSSLRHGPDDNPTVGIILCAQKDKSVVRYSVLEGNEQLFATRYKLILPSEEQLRAELVREQRLLEGQVQENREEAQP